MRRILIAAALAGGCTGGITIDDPGPNTATPDAGGGGGIDAGSGAPGFTCRNQVNNPGSGNHHPGEDCQGPCHNHGFTLAGTIFSGAAATPMIGATITAVDAAGKTIDIVSRTNGNFYTSQSIAFPVTVTASDCPSVAPMITKVTAAMAGCNQAGCHVTAAQGRIHLP